MTRARRASAFLLGGLVAGALVLGVAAQADAHDPIILTPDQTTPAAGPRLPDGTISFALYGTLAGGDARGFRAALKAGQRLELTLLVPDLAPERELTDDALPHLTVAAPDGTVVDHRADRRETFSESFSGTNYVRLLEVAEPVATTGEYGIIVTGTTPARFTVAIGSIERFGTPVDDVPNRDEGVAGVRRWYATPPVPLAAEGATSTDASSTDAASTTTATTATAPSTTSALSPTSTAATSTAAVIPAANPPVPTTTAAPPATGSRSPTMVVGAVIILAAGAKVMLNRNRRARRNQV